MRSKIIECPMKVIDIFPYGKILVPDIEKLKEFIKKLEFTKLKGGKNKMSEEELKQELEDIRQKLNEVVACLEDNNLSRKVQVDYLYQEEEETPEETEEVPLPETPLTP